MMATPKANKIRIKLHLEGTHITSQTIMDSLKLLEEAMQVSDEKILNEAINELDFHPDIHKIIEKESSKLMRPYDKRRVGFQTAQNGSIELLGEIAAAGYVALIIAIGKLLKDVVTETAVRKKLKELLVLIIDKKTNGIVGFLDKAINKQKKKKANKMKAVVEKKQGTNHITFSIKDAYYNDKHNFHSWNDVIAHALYEDLEDTPDTLQ